MGTLLLSAQFFCKRKANKSISIKSIKKKKRLPVGQNQIVGHLEL